MDKPLAAGAGVAKGCCWVPSTTLNFFCKCTTFSRIGRHDMVSEVHESRLQTRDKMCSKAFGAKGVTTRKASFHDVRWTAFANEK